VVVLAYALGMAGFTMIMGNAFAAFPVMTAGIGLPLLVQGTARMPASLAAIGMLSGYCGTLMTPMAANFNLVPAALLELRDPYAVIRVQIRPRCRCWRANVLLMYFIVFRCSTSTSPASACVWPASANVRRSTFTFSGCVRARSTRSPPSAATSA
jgi:uncharacterized membrane protein